MAVRQGEITESTTSDHSFVFSDGTFWSTVIPCPFRPYSASPRVKEQRDANNHDDLIAAEGASVEVPLVDILCGFFRVGLTAFGGPAMIPHLRSLVVARHGWITEDDFRIGVSICQAIPGATVMQLAAYVGLRVRGLAGALIAFCGFGLPAFLLITGLSALYFRYQNLPVLLSAFSGLKVIVIVILLSASMDFIDRFLHGIADRLLALGASIAFLASIHPALILVGAAMIGVAAFNKGSNAARMTPSRPKVRSSLGPLLFLTLALAVGVMLLWILRRELYQLAILMMGVDLLAFGGGFAALPIMLHEVVVRMGWLTEKVFLDGIALGQVTPGPIVLTSAFVGYALAGITGSLVGSIAVFSPSFLLLVWAVPFCDRLLGSPAFRRALRASLATLAGLMAAVTGTLSMSITWSVLPACLGVAAFIALRSKVDILWVVLIGGGVSLVVL